jgi:hypothetical protein
MELEISWASIIDPSHMIAFLRLALAILGPGKLVGQVKMGWFSSWKLKSG